jgi:hypothetical protein
LCTETFIVFEIWGSHSGVAEDSSLQGCHSVLLGEKILAITMPSSSRVMCSIQTTWLLKIKKLLTQTCSNTSQNTRILNYTAVKTSQLTPKWIIRNIHDKFSCVCQWSGIILFLDQDTESGSSAGERMCCQTGDWRRLSSGQETGRRTGKIKWYITYTVHFIIKLILTNKCTTKVTCIKCIWEPLHMFQQTSCHLQGIFSRELQEMFTSNYTVNGYTLKITEHAYVTVIIHRCINVQYLKLKMVKHYISGAPEV